MEIALPDIGQIIAIFRSLESKNKMPNLRNKVTTSLKSFTTFGRRLDFYKPGE